MKKFLSDLVVKFIDGVNWEVDEEFDYEVNNGSDKIIHIPKGFITDFASIPRFAWWIIGDPTGEYGPAAVIHDYLYRNGIGTRAEADKIFYDAMGVLKVNNTKRKIIYYAVRVFGVFSFKKKK